MPTPIITDGTMERVVSAPRVVLADPATLFTERAARFAQLARGHAMGEYLELMAALVRAQHAVIGRRAALPVPAAALEQSRDYGMPPLSALSHARDPQWRADLADLAAELAGEPRAAASLGPILDRERLTERVARRGGPPSRFDERSFCRLLRTGEDPAGVILPRAMPRYEIDDADCLRLWRYLTRPTA